MLVWWDHWRLLRYCGVTAEGFWRVRRSYPALVDEIANAGVSLERLAMFAGQDVAGFQIEIEGLQGHGAVVI